MPNTFPAKPIPLDLITRIIFGEDYLLTYSMVQSPSWEANWFASSQEIPRISWNSKVHYRSHKLPPTVPVLGQPNPLHIPTSHLLEIHPNIIHPSTHGLPSSLFPSGFPTKTLYAPLSSPIRATCSEKILIYLLTYTMVQSPSWETDWFAASQGILCISRNPKVHYRTHKRPPNVSIQGLPITPHPTSWRSTLLLSTPTSPQWSLSL